MAAVNISYKYNIELKFVLDGTVHEIDQFNIKTVVVIRNYDTSNMPVIYVTMKLDRSLYAKMLDCQTTSYAILSMYKYDFSLNKSYRSEYIKDKFIYLLPKDINYKKLAMNDQTQVNDDSIGKNAHINASFALLKMDIMNDNKTMMNDIIKNSNNISIINHYFNNHDIVIEPFDNNEIKNTIIIPPIKSKTLLLEYLNKNSSFYNDGNYRFFMDFNRFYLLSNKGVYVDTEDNQFNTIMINVFYDLDNPNVKQGVAVDDTSKSYTFNVSSSNAKMSIDKYKSKSFNSILGVDTSGNVRKVKMDLPLNIDDDEKIDVRRVPNGNLNYVNYIKDVSEMSTVILTVTKSDMDNEIITPNKEYLVNNYSSYSEYNGNYILSFKKETFVQQSNDFVCATVFGLRKVNG